MEYNDFKDSLDRYEKKKFPFTTKFFKDTVVENDEAFDYSESRSVLIKEVFGIGIIKKMKKKKIRSPIEEDDDRTNIIGFSNSEKRSNNSNNT